MRDEPRVPTYRIYRFSSTASQADRIVQATDLIELLLPNQGWGPEGFAGSLEMLICPVPGFHNADLLGHLRKAGVSPEGEWHQVLCASATGYMRQDRPLPGDLREYIAGVLQHGPPKRRQGKDNFARDLSLVMAVRFACLMTGLPVSRNPATDPADGPAGASGCSIVSESLRKFGVSLSAKRIAAIHTAWQRRYPHPLRLLELDE